jgi:hypothetical protein
MYACGPAVCINSALMLSVPGALIFIKFFLIVDASYVGSSKFCPEILGFHSHNLLLIQYFVDQSGSFFSISLLYELPRLTHSHFVL